jgi:16S rRNA (guanine966-N2)-methyltransferase
VRVISGNLGGRIFKAPSNKATHPMSEKVLGALFNTLGDIEGLTLLDAFAGSGAISFEAISRGAKHVTAVEQDRNAQQTITENIELLGVSDDIKLIHANALAWSTSSGKGLFDLVILDPPYDKDTHKLVSKLSARTDTTGILVLSWPGREIAPELDNFEIIDQHNYGDAQLIYYKKK